MENKNVIIYFSVGPLQTKMRTLRMLLGSGIFVECKKNIVLFLTTPPLILSKRVKPQSHAKCF